MTAFLTLHLSRCSPFEYRRCVAGAAARVAEQRQTIALPRDSVADLLDVAERYRALNHGELDAPPPVKHCDLVICGLPLVTVAGRMHEPDTKLGLQVVQILDPWPPFPSRIQPDEREDLGQFSEHGVRA